MQTIAQHLRPTLLDKRPSIAITNLCDMPPDYRIIGDPTRRPETLPLPMLEPKKLGAPIQDQPADHQDKLLIHPPG